jgi:hypothetical protein
MEDLMEDAMLFQIFLSPAGTPGPGIFEVSLLKNKSFVCTCPGFAGRKVCKHTKLVEARVQQNKGTYPLELSERCNKEDMERAMDSPESFRQHIIKYGKIEVC